MYEQKYIGVLHPRVALRYLDFLFYDHFQLMEMKYPTNEDSELLFNSDIVKPLDDSINLSSPDLKIKHPDILSELEAVENHYWKIFRLITPTAKITELPVAPESDVNLFEDALDGYLKRRLEEVDAIQASNTLSQMSNEVYLHKTQACAALLSLNTEVNAIPILPENINPYSKLVSGHVLKFISIGVPRMPIRDIIKFKYDNQDKLRELRLAINKLYNAHNNFDYMLEELSIALEQYNRSVVLLNKKYELEDMELKLGLFEKIGNFLSSFDLSVFGESFKLEKTKIQKQIDIETIVSSDASYLYEVGHFLKEKSRYNTITI